MTVVIFYRLLEMDHNAKPSATFNRTQAQNNRRKKAPGIELDYAINNGDKFIDWQCKLCHHASKSGNAPCLREHFLRGPRKRFTCPHPSAPVIAKHLREEFQNKVSRKHYASFSTTPTMPKNHGSNHETPQTLPGCTTTLNVEPKTNLPSSSSSK